METIKKANMGLSFLMELAMWLAFGYLGFHGFGGVTGWLIGLGLPILTILIWSRWAAPKSKKRLKQPGLIKLKTVLFYLAGIALLTVNKNTWAIIFFALATINLLLEYHFDTRHHRQKNT
jgi:hypothetical protein